MLSLCIRCLTPHSSHTGAAADHIAVSAADNLRRRPQVFAIGGCRGQHSSDKSSSGDRVKYQESCIFVLRAYKRVLHRDIEFM